MKSQHLQFFLAAIFFGLGGWCIVDPHGVERLGFRPEYQHLSASTGLLIACFGAQAVLVSILIAFSKFTPRTFLVFGLVGSVPFFIFNWYFVFIVQMFTPFMLIDFVGNLGILMCGLIGYWLSRRELASQSS